MWGCRGSFQPSFWYRRNGKRVHKFGRPTVADYVVDTFPYSGLQRQQQGQYQHQEQERYHHHWQQEQSLSPSIPPSPVAIQDQPPDDLPNSTDQTFQSQSVNTT
jgi:hypothetical protein